MVYQYYSNTHFCNALDQFGSRTIFRLIETVVDTQRILIITHACWNRQQKTETHLLTLIIIKKNDKQNKELIN